MPPRRGSPIIIEIAGMACRSPRAPEWTASRPSLSNKPARAPGWQMESAGAHRGLPRLGPIPPPSPRRSAGSACHPCNPIHTQQTSRQDAACWSSTGPLLLGSRWAKTNPHTTASKPCSERGRVVRASATTDPAAGWGSVCRAKDTNCCEGSMATTDSQAVDWQIAA